MNDAPATPSSTTAPPKTDWTAASVIGFLLCRIIVPSWVLAGAIYKLAELNPNLLPPPVLWTSNQIGTLLGQDPTTWLGFSMRFIIGTEIMLAGLMYFVPRVSRLAAGGVLTLFVVILVLVLAQGYDGEKGISSLLSGQCGCFGSAGPPPIVMLLIDGLLLLGVLFFRAPQRPVRSAPIAVALSVLVAFTVAFIIPDQQVANPTANGTPANDVTGEDGSPVLQTDAQGWPLPPAMLEGYYVPQFNDWTGKTLSSIPFMHLLPRPLPEGFNEGTWLLVFYRADCEHCQELFLIHFSDPELPVPTLAIGIPDYQPEGALEFLCDGCLVTELPAGTDYLIQTPAIIRVEDGVVTCAVDGSNDESEIEACIYGSGGE